MAHSQSLSHAADTAAPPQEGLKETIESIVVALILAFVFRAFIVEAFVIPTGSMAPTLYGAHGTIVCSDCGWEFAYGLRDPSETRPSADVVVPQSRAVCPNCSHANTNLAITDRAGNAETGDRILVLKWPFDLGGAFFGPKRWDVSVFKNPADGVQNYIKRLTGLPQEVLMIVDGDVYTVPNSQLSEAARKELDELRHQKYLVQTRQKGAKYPNPSADLMNELSDKMTIARKTQEAQKSLWFVVYDHDHLPGTVDAGQPRWSALQGTSSAWQSSDRVLRYDGREPARDYIELQSKPIAADYAYNLAAPTSGYSAPPVADQRLRFVFTPHHGDGILRVRLAKGGRQFWASLHADGRVTLIESSEIPTATTPVMVERQSDPLRYGRSVEVCFENVDYRLALSVGGREVVASSSDPRSPAFYGPNLKSLLNQRRPPEASPPRLFAERLRFDIAHLVVERDIYYYDTHNPLHDRIALGGWGTAGNPILLRSGEYFMLGDNSPASQDSRLWGDVTPNKYLTARGEDYQLGTVPEDQLIGKAFFVYWPSPHRIGWLPMPKGWGLIPDVGRMRWIR